MSARVDPVVISVFSDECIGGTAVGTNANNSSANSPLNSSNDIYYYPFRLAEPFKVRAVGVHNGSANSGNVDVGIYSEDGTKIWSAGSTANAGASVVQLFTPTAFTLPPGRYYMAVAADNTTASFRVLSPGEAGRCMGVLMGSAFPLPSTMASAAAISSAKTRAPIMFISRRLAI